MTKNLYDISVKTITGKPVTLSEYRGKVLLIVNVASECGLTPQYAGLESIYEKYRSKGFEVLGFPANEFGKQEPGTNAQIQEFCRTQFGVKFPMFEKIVVKGEGQHPLYALLTSAGGAPKDISWNFEKFLIGRDGAVAARFNPQVVPDAPEVLAAIEKAL